jgi:hypothetical protein
MKLAHRPLQAAVDIRSEEWQSYSAGDFLLD